MDLPDHGDDLINVYKKMGMKTHLNLNSSFPLLTSFNCFLSSCISLWNFFNRAWSVRTSFTLGLFVMFLALDANWNRPYIVWNSMIKTTPVWSYGQYLKLFSEWVTNVNVTLRLRSQYYMSLEICYLKEHCVWTKSVHKQKSYG